MLSIHSRHCSLALGNPCSPSERLLHLHPAHQTDLPTYLPKALASDCSCQRGGERCAPLLVSLITTPSPLHPPQWRLPPCPTHQLPHTVRGQSRTLLQTCEHPPSIRAPMSLLLPLAFLRSWSWVSTGTAGLGMQPNNWKKRYCPKKSPWVEKTSV